MQSVIFYLVGNGEKIKECDAQQWSKSSLQAPHGNPVSGDSGCLHQMKG